MSDGRAGRRTALQRTTKSCGPDASAVGVKSAEVSKPYRADKTLIRRRWCQTSPITRESTNISVKTTAQGKSNWRSLSSGARSRDPLAGPVCSCAHSFAQFCTRDRGCSAHPAFPAPFFLERVRQLTGKPRAHRVARMPLLAMTLLNIVALGCLKLKRGTNTHRRPGLEPGPMATGSDIA